MDTGGEQTAVPKKDGNDFQHHRLGISIRGSHGKEPER